MKHLFTLLIIFFFNLIFSQNKISEITGKWVKIKAEMKDGSKLFDRFMTDSMYLEYTITKDKICFNSDPMYTLNNSCNNYTLTENLLKTSEYSGYLIEKITNDSLIISEKVENMTNDKLKRIYFVKKEVIFSEFKEKNKNTENIVASKLFTPKIIAPIEVDIFKAFKGNYSNFELIGNLKILPKKHQVKTQITFSTQKDSSRIRTVKKIIDNSFEKWDIANFDEYESIEIAFVLKSEISKTYNGVKLIFFTQDLNQFNEIYGSRLEDMRESSALFTNGIKAYQEKKYTKAIEYFTKSYKIDPKNIDALYNKAAVYFESGDNLNACKTWKEISALGQVAAKELYQNNCK